jgi:iron(III) transport system permease protein
VQAGAPTDPSSRDARPAPQLVAAGLPLSAAIGGDAAILPSPFDPIPQRIPRRAASDGRWGGRIAVWMVVLPLLLPLLLLALTWGEAEPAIWTHLRQHVLVPVAWNTFALAMLVATGVSIIGIPLAWLSAHCDYPGRRWLDWGLVLPLAMPTYVVAFAYVGLLDYAGPVQSLWRGVTGSSAALYDGRGLIGAAALLSLVLYPYVYLLARAAFLRQGAAAFDAARALGRSPRQAFLRVALPMIRPAWVAGAGLAVLETLADFGAVSILGVDTFTTAIYKTWFSLFSLPAAAQLASLLLLAVAAVLLLERLLRGRAAHRSTQVRPMPRIVLTGARGWTAAAFGIVVLALGFLIPATRLLDWALQTGPDWSMLSLLAGHTFLLGLLVAAAVLLVGLHIASAEFRAPQDRWRRSAAFAATLGYAIPGTVLAVAVMLLLLRVETAIDASFGVRLMLSSSLLGVVFALLLRFLRVAHGTLDAGFAQLKPSLLESARLLGASRWRRLTQVVLPHLRPSVFAALLLVLVETMKEMPATLMLRPFGWDTLAVRIYGYTSEGLWAEAAWPALLLVAIGLLPVWLLGRARG